MKKNEKETIHRFTCAGKKTCARVLARAHLPTCIKAIKALLLSSFCKPSTKSK